MNGRVATNFLAEQTVWRPDANTNQSLTVFGGGLIYQGGAPYWAQYYAGLSQSSPLRAGATARHPCLHRFLLRE